MNEHLKIVFEALLPELEGAKVDYWVYGGVSIAAYAEYFIRENSDVDIFVKDTDFRHATLMLDSLCERNSLKLKHDLKKGRPKVEIDKKFSMIPIYQKKNAVLFKYGDGDQEYPHQILERVERSISSYRFFTPQNKFIKDLFIKHIEARPDKKTQDKIRKDATAILSLKELSILGITPLHNSKEQF